MGGEITWKALGGDDFQFTLVIYRDCNGLDIIDPTLNIRVWGHTSVDNILCNFVSSTDLSPDCTPVLGGPAELDCGSGTGGGTGPGAVQKFVYQSAPITLAGTPPAEGWAFTYDSFSRNWDVTNIEDPFSFGFTLSSIMYDVPDDCLDSSPEFAQDPYILLCRGSDFQFDSNAFDEDNDSLVFSWGVPLDHFPAGSFNPPVNPVPVPFVAGFSFDNPTPDASFDPDNVPAVLDPNTGQITFKSNTIGSFGFVQKIDCYRDGVLIATINRESQLIVIPCPGYDNTPPEIVPPFGGGTSYDAEFFAGDLINFDIEVIDNEFLQDGTPQTVTLIPTGNAFGDNLTDPLAGCDYLPCATLDMPPLIQGVQGVTANFNWQTSCDHLLDACGVQQAEQVYTFVLNAKDDYCMVPGRRYETIRIKIKNNPPVTAADMNCIDVLDDGSAVLSWTPSVDAGSSFTEYEVWSATDGLLTTIPTIATDTYTVLGSGTDLAEKQYYVVTKFGCDGGNSIYSDTLSSIFMEFNDLADGRVSLKWNDTHLPRNNGENEIQQIYREYPIGVWTLRGEVTYGTNLFIDTIDVCEDFMSYEIRVGNDAGCESTSNKEGAILSDIINPIIPVLTSASINPISCFAEIEWDVNPSEDTFGYIVYVFIDGFWEPVDTVFGRFNNTYTYVATTADEEPEGYRIAAFDSCLTPPPVTYQTSALSPSHTTVHLTESYDLCDRSIGLEWTPYLGWVEEVARYEVLVSIGGSPYEVISTIESANLRFTDTDLIYDVNYCYYIRAVSVNGTMVNSNKMCRLAERPSQPAFHYLTTATHQLNDGIEIVCYTDGAAIVERYEIEVKEPFDSDFSLIAEIAPISGFFFSYVDENVFPERGEYQYRINLIDQCGRVGATSNVGKTSFLEVTTDHVRMLHTLSWSAYTGFDGDITEYNVYRGENGVFETAPIATTLPGVRSYVDDVSATIDPLVYIPNAFIPRGANPVFLPVISLYDFDSYNLVIYSRYGEQIFNTTDRFLGWNGMNERDGQLYQEGVYVYQLTFRDRAGNDYDYQGTVTFIHGEN